MLLTICTFADDAKSARDGKLSITGAHNAVAVQSLPGRVALKLVLRLVPEPDDHQVPQQVTLRIRRPDGTEMTNIAADPVTFDIPKLAPVDLDQVLDLTVQFDAEGRYSFDVEINGAPAGRTPLIVMERPELIRMAGTRK